MEAAFLIETLVTRMATMILQVLTPSCDGLKVMLWTAIPRNLVEKYQHFSRAYRP